MDVGVAHMRNINSEISDALNKCEKIATKFGKKEKNTHKEYIRIAEKVNELYEKKTKHKIGNLKNKLEAQGGRTNAQFL